MKSGAVGLIPLVAALAAGPAVAKPRPLASLADPALAAVGWFGPGPGPVPRHGGCTAVLVAPDLVLTATHCMSQDERSPPPRPQSFVFAPGWPGSGTTVFRAAEVFLTAPRELLGGSLPFDIALVRLEEAVPPTVAAPLPVAGPDDRTYPAATTVGYPSRAPDEPVADNDCAVVMDDSSVLGLGCPSHPGYSGGPVLIVGQSGWEVEAIVVAQNRPEPIAAAIAAEAGPVLRTYAVRPPDDLLQRVRGN